MMYGIFLFICSIIKKDIFKTYYIISRYLSLNLISIEPTQMTKGLYFYVLYIMSSVILKHNNYLTIYI